MNHAINPSNSRRQMLASAAALLGVAAAWTGTSLFYYSTVFPFMAHGVAFALLVALLRVVHDIDRRGATSRRLAVAGILIAGLWLVRPQQR